LILRAEGCRGGRWAGEAEETEGVKGAIKEPEPAGDRIQLKKAKKQKLAINELFDTIDIKILRT
jgi:hypothetical protein